MVSTASRTFSIQCVYSCYRRNNFYCFEDTWSLDIVFQQLDRTAFKTMIYFFLCIAFLLSASTATADNAYRFDNLMLEKEAKVSCISFGHNGSLWLGLDGMGLARRESKDSKIVYYSRLLGTLPSDIVLCTYRDSKGRQWFGSFGDGPFWFDLCIRIKRLYYLLVLDEIAPNDLYFREQKRIALYMVLNRYCSKVERFEI